MNLSRLALSALHDRERSGRRQAAPRPSQAYNPDCPERHAAEIVIAMTQEANEDWVRTDEEDDQVDPTLTYIGVKVKVPAWDDKEWGEYVRVFQPIVFEGLRAIREYAYDYARKHTGRELKDDDGDCTTESDWNNPMHHYSAAMANYPWGYAFGRGCYFQWFPEALVNRDAFKTMCEIAIDRMSGLPTKVLKPPSISYYIPEGATLTRDGTTRSQSGASPWFFCGVQLCVAEGLGHVDPDRKEETNPRLTEEQYRAIERRAGQQWVGPDEWDE
jgi:hypothetical protein